MKTITSLLILLATSAWAEPSDTEKLGQAYFAAWSATQAPNATAKDLEHYLSFLTDDVGHQHLPYDPDDTREAGNKQRMREGMTYYLAGHDEYDDELISINHAKDLLIIEYRYKAKFVRKESDQTEELNEHNIEVLELEDGKVSVIRKYNR